MREQVEVLEHHADFAPHLVDLLQVVGQFDAVDDDLAALMLFQPVDAADHRRFARAGGAADDDALAAHDLQIDVACSTWKSPYHLFMPMISTATSVLETCQVHGRCAVQTDRQRFLLPWNSTP